MRIAVLLHERQIEDRLRFYGIAHLADLWRAEGLEVVFVYGTRDFVPADAAFVHVDLSVVPDEYLELAARYPVALNGRVKDIRKSTFSTLRVTAERAYAGPVIVKTDLNYAGIPEQVLGVAAEGELPFREPADYPIFDSVAEVPSHLLDDDRLIVERFVPEGGDGRYHFRSFEFLGDCHTCVRFTSHKPVPTTGKQPDWVHVEPHPELFELRRALRLDYGKLDYVVHDGTLTLLDVNKTPGTTSGVTDPRVLDLRSTRAPGIHFYLR